MTPRHTHLGILVLALISTITASFAAPLTLHQYLENVKTKHEGYIASKNSAEGSEARSKDSSLIFAPNLFFAANFLDDAKPTAVPAFMGTETTNSTYTLGVSKMTNFGLLSKLYYLVSYTTIAGVSPTLLAVPTFYEARPVLEISQSLWKNGFGAEITAGTQAQEAQALATSYGERYKSKMLLMQAEQYYWRLALARETVRVKRSGLERAQRLKAYSDNRARLELADKADVFQADAALQLRTMELQAALDEEHSAIRAFLSLLGTDGDAITDELVDFSPEKFVAMDAPPRNKDREDVMAAREGLRAAEAAYELYLHKNKPTFDVTGSVALNGRDAAFGTATGNSFQTSAPTYSIGLKLIAPLEFGLINSTREGAFKERQAAELNARRKTFEVEVEWTDLNNRLSQAKKRLELVTNIERIQKNKLDHERERHKKGRSTTYQILAFEQDYSQSEFGRIQTQAEILTLVAQMKTFGSPQ
ncbi:MAG: TolC family protein [Deltaproteobacteria bacterium]|nr:TolC family protein [Deltaproteobacteria bacterium]MBI3293348.1 TolC family protein [Deltaproteobacteria bacterium]